MSSKSDIPEFTGGEDADNHLENKALDTNDQFQIKMNFDEKEKADRLAEQEFKEWAEAEMKNRAKEGQRLKEKLEARRVMEEDLKMKEAAEAMQKAAEEQRVIKDSEAKRIAEEAVKFEEEALAKKLAEDKQRLIEEAEAKEIVDEAAKLEEDALAKKTEAEKIEDEKKIRLEEARTERKIQEDRRIKKAEEAIRQRDEEWQKFKEEADFRKDQETTETRDDTPKPKEVFNEAAHTKKAGSNRKVLFFFLFTVVAVAAILIFSVLNDGADESVPFYPENAETGVEETGVRPESESGAADQANTEDTDVPQSPETDTPEAPSSTAAVGDTFGEGILFKIDATGKTGTLAFAKDMPPMTWENAMDIKDQLGEGWRLPTMSELSEMYAVIGPGSTNSGEFTDDLYWSSDAYDENQARLVRFSDGNTSFHYNNRAEYRKFRVRAVRDFSR